jgi:asparagine synthase (glutamine-hydrolysing)
LRPLSCPPGSYRAIDSVMCGIAGVVNLAIDCGSQAALVEKMLIALRHRGPDGGGVARHQDATVGMRRLAIVDVAGGDQPMYSGDGSIAIVYNGEIYNAPALRSRLQKEGISFRTRSDTEVILRLYERDPARVEEELVGMWAFAIHDRARRRLLLSRDRFGIKPLFVADTGTALAFASELHCFPVVAATRGSFARLLEIDPGAAHAMMAWSYVPETQTIYRGVSRLPPGTRLEVDLATARRAERCYWALRPSDEASRVRNVDEACDLIDPLLRRAVREHLESDVPVATFLSGGIDSSLVTAYAAAESRNPIVAYSIGFLEPDFDESQYARKTADVLGIEDRVAVLDDVIASRTVLDAILSFDEPFGDSSSVAMFLLARMAARHHKVALGGDGADEAFAGYKKHTIVGVRAALAPLGPLRSMLARGLAALPIRVDRTSRVAELLRTAQRLAVGLDGTDAMGHLALTQVVPLALAAPFMHSPATELAFADLDLERFTRAPGTMLQKTLACDLASPLANDMLTKVDRTTMAMGLEARVPFLDHRLVEAGVGLPSRISTGKRVLRALHERRFGAELARRKKKGFRVPVEKWLRGHLAPVCDALFATERLRRFGVLSAEVLGHGRWRDFATTAPQVLWHAFSLAAWCESTLGGGPDALREVFRCEASAQGAARNPTPVRAGVLARPGPP